MMIQLQKDQERRLLAGHLWIYSNEINTQRTPFSHYQAGDIVQVVSAQGKALGMAYINPHTLLCARLLTWDSHAAIDVAFFENRLLHALRLRQRLYPEPYYRWVFSESDFLPGLIIDRFNDVVVIQVNTAGMDRLTSFILEAVVRVIAPQTVIWRNDTAYRALEGLPSKVEVAYGDAMRETYEVHENQCTFITSLAHGQKTGWFYDHRDNRQRILKYVRDKIVLDLFSYVGSFAIPLAKAGARQVVSVDSSQVAIEYLRHNAESNGVSAQIETVIADAFDFLAAAIGRGVQYDVIIIDPPAFIKKKKEYDAGLRAYEKLNTMALSVLSPGGVLLTASCSMHLSADDLCNILRRASIKTKRKMVITEQLHQGCDHPVHPAIAETHYLKGFIAVDTGIL